MNNPTEIPQITVKTESAASMPLTDLAAYPILTEEIGYPPSPLARTQGSGGGAGRSGGGSGDLGSIVNKAVSDVLGWRIKPGDAKGFVGALTQSFTLSETEGHVNAAWTPRTYAVQTDLAGGISGAQASIYSRGRDAVDSSLPLLEGLYSLNPEAIKEDIDALKAVAKSQMSELANELGMLPPRISRVNQYFNLLLGDATFPAFPKAGQALSITDPDVIGGTLGNLRDELGLNFATQDFVNSVDNEQNLSNFRIVSDYITSLAQSWLNNLGYLTLNTKTPFFGTQLVLLSRQLLVVSESVDEVRFTLDSVFIGPAERQTMQVNFNVPGVSIPSIYLEDLLAWIQSFAAEEGPRLIQQGGKFAVQNTFYPVVKNLLTMTAHLNGANGLPQGFYTPRVKLSIIDLRKQLNELGRLAKPIEHIITPEPNFGLAFSLDGIQPASTTMAALAVAAANPADPAKQVYTTIRGAGFESTATVKFTKGAALPIEAAVFFRSESLLVVQVPAGPGGLTAGNWTVSVYNPDGNTGSLPASFSVTP